jgi:hypothetical protein
MPRQRKPNDLIVVCAAFWFGLAFNAKLKRARLVRLFGI